MNHRPRFSALAAICLPLVVLALSGCAMTPVDDAATPTGTRYRGTLSGGASREDLAESDKARALDPCGMLDEAAITALGTALYFGIGQRLDECEVRLDRVTLARGITTVGVSLSVLPHFGTNSFRIGDRRASPLLSDETCFIALEYNKRRAFHYWATASPGVDPCAALRDIVTVSAPLLQESPLRVNSTRVPKTRSAMKDPCAALDSAFEPGQTFYLSMLSPYECNIWLGQHSRDDSNRFGIEVFNVAKSQASYVPSQARKLMLAGVESVEESNGDGHCSIRAYVGVDKPFSTRTWDGKPEDRIDALRISGPGCAETRALAVAAVKSYQQD
ncbi:hypothetical protein [Nocardia asiatica]|uniref:hypothetical protein n=1 Tax=Nocardia asiatica TaxID=209252 RepID=UPI0002D988AE|nr:hypothetical protein [Nocardia asiatica]